MPYELVDNKGGYNHAESERPCLNSAKKMAMFIGVISGNTSNITLEYMCERKRYVYIHVLVDKLNNQRLNFLEKNIQFQLKQFDAAVTLKYSHGL